MSPQLVTYPTWEEMFGKHPTKAELIEEIRPLDTGLAKVRVPHASVFESWGFDFFSSRSTLIFRQTK